MIHYAFSAAFKPRGTFSGLSGKLLTRVPPWCRCSASGLREVAAEVDEVRDQIHR